MSDSKIRNVGVDSFLPISITLKIFNLKSQEKLRKMRLTHIMLDCIYIHTTLKRLFILYLIPIPIPISYNFPRLVVFLKL